MNLSIIYFSQTGNTRKVAEAMAAAFREAGHTVRALPLKKASPQDAITGDLLGIGTPCFSSQAPTPVKDFLRALSALDKQRAFVFATAGGAPGRVLYDLTRGLQAKNAEVVGGFLTRGESHHPAPCLLGRTPNRPNAADLADARRFAIALSAHITNGRSGPAPESHPATFKPNGWFYNWVARCSTDSVLRWLSPAPKINAARCTQCQWCVRECPVQAITLAPYPVLGPACIRCYRCVTGCPQKAYTADWRWGNLITWTLYNERFERWFGDLKPGETL
ncbi:MAG TPA: EFR1 family ferrodoxin [Anaerolineae bacterium]|nr:EFR1 family ferrodoxin [Anaerolineae bacterium]